MIRVVGLGTGDLHRIPDPTRAILEDPSATVVLRTIEHPAARQLAENLDVVACDDLYQAASTFDEVYERIVERLRSVEGDVVYAVPGSPTMGEFVVRRLLDEGDAVEVTAGHSFVDVILAEVGYDPLERGLTILNAHDLPEPLVLSTPTIIAQLDHPALIADLSGRLSRMMPEGTLATLLVGVGTTDQRVERYDVAALDPELASVATSLYIDAEPGGLQGAIRTMARLRRECPWDREQTRETLVQYLFEESAEFADAVAAVDGPDDWVGIGHVSDELGDVLLQVLFQAVIASERGEFDLDDVAEGLRQKLVRRHPHVFGDVVADSPDQVRANWRKIKQSEGSGASASMLDDVSSNYSALASAMAVQSRMAEVGFDWQDASGVREKLTEELTEFDETEDDIQRLAELGDVLFTVVNLSRHLDIDPDLALRQATARFSDRVRQMEAIGPLEDLPHDELEARWERAKR